MTCPEDRALFEKLDDCHKTRSLGPWSTALRIGLGVPARRDRYYEFVDESVLKMDRDGSWPIVW